MRTFKKLTKMGIYIYSNSKGSDMKKILLITLPVLFCLNLCCAGRMVTGSNIKKELIKTAESIKKDRSLIYTLDKKTIGKTGYFYIIRNDGRISYHPKKGLINFNFSEYPFTKKILKERNGCLTYTVDAVVRNIFYRELDADEILCLTIDSNEFDETVYECETPAEKNK
jgi:hypothetical protein